MPNTEVKLTNADGTRNWPSASFRTDLPVSVKRALIWHI